MEADKENSSFGWLGAGTVGLSVPLASPLFFFVCVCMCVLGGLLFFDFFTFTVFDEYLLIVSMCILGTESKVVSNRVLSLPSGSSHFSEGRSK